MDSRTELLKNFLDPVGRSLSAEAARKLLELRTTPKVQEQMDDLADRCTEGRLTDSERADYQTLIGVSELIALLQDQARKALARPTPATPSSSSDT